MSEEKLLEELKAIMVKNGLCEEDANITMETNIRQDLDADSLDFVDLIIELEDKYQISIEDEDAQSFTSVKDVVDYIKERI